MTPEGRVKAAVKKRLGATKAWYFMPVQNGMGRVGIPDFIICLPVIITPEMVGKEFGAFVAIETKAPGKLATLTANQRNEINGIRLAGGAAIVTDDAANLTTKGTR